MKKLLITLLIFGNFSAYGFEDKTYFETLGDMFKMGTKPEPKKLLNVLWVGRCFYEGTPNEAENGGYILRKNQSDVGPIGNNREEYEAISFSRPYKPANYYDNMKLSEALALWGSFDVVTSTPTSLVTYYDDFLVEVRLSNQYLMSEGRPVSKPDKPFVRCYYFIPGYVNQ